MYRGQNVNTGIFGDEFRSVDIGVGLSVNDDGSIDTRSAFSISNSGITLLGSGTDENGITNNLYALLGDIADKIENNDLDDIQLYSDKLSEKSDDIRLQYVSVGEKSNFISYFIDRLDSEQQIAKKSKKA